MDDENFTVIITGKAKPGMEDYIRRNLIAMMEHSRKDQGCVAYNIHESINDPAEFMVYMVWKSRTAFDQHNLKPEMQEFKKILAAQWFEQQSPKSLWRLLS